MGNNYLYWKIKVYLKKKKNASKYTSRYSNWQKYVPKELYGILFNIFKIVIALCMIWLSTGTVKSRGKYD